MALQSSAKSYSVFISHAGEDKATIASPLRNMLGELGIPAFVDENDIRPGCNATAEMASAMESADVAVIVLSPEFVAKKWPMKELLFFLNRRKNSQADGGAVPVIVPVFYRLSVQDMYREPRFERKDADGKSLYRKTRFFERFDNGEPEADVNVIQSALKTLHGVMGVENKYHASNEESSLPSRLLLLKDVCAKVSQIMTEQVGKRHRGRNDEDPPSTSGEANKFRPRFCREPLHDVFLDFESKDRDGRPLTVEGDIKNRILNRQGHSKPIFAIHGIGGVGKSTILKALANDKDLRFGFGDGMYLISLGMDATVGTLVRELCQVLHDSGALKYERGRMRTEHIREAFQAVASWFQGKRCAFLIDDVWTSKISEQIFSQLLKWLERAGPDIVIVFTTRERDIASVAPIENMLHVLPREVLGSVSTTMLFNHAGITESSSVDECTKPLIREVLGICSGLPVSLAAAGKGVKMLRIDTDAHHAWKEYLMMIRNYRERLLQENVAGYGNLYITFGASLSLLEEGRRERLGFKTPASFGEMHRRLCVLQKQATVPASMLKNLWGLQNEAEAKIVGNLFVQVGLAECKYGYIHENSWHLCMHDSLHDYATLEATRYEDVVRAHQILLDGYSWPRADLLSKEEGQREWPCLAEQDGYIYQNLCRHLCEAGRAMEIGSLVTFLWAFKHGQKRNPHANVYRHGAIHVIRARRAVHTLYIGALEFQIMLLEEECRRITARQREEWRAIEQLKQGIKNFESGT